MLLVMGTPPWLQHHILLMGAISSYPAKAAAWGAWVCWVTQQECDTQEWASPAFIFHPGSA